jgi:hypothetical protein
MPLNLADNCRWPATCGQPRSPQERAHDEFLLAPCWSIADCGPGVYLRPAVGQDVPNHPWLSRDNPRLAHFSRLGN